MVFRLVANNHPAGSIKISTTFDLPGGNFILPGSILVFFKKVTIFGKPEITSTININQASSFESEYIFRIDVDSGRIHKLYPFFRTLIAYNSRRLV